MLTHSIYISIRYSLTISFRLILYFIFRKVNDVFFSIAIEIRLNVFGQAVVQFFQSSITHPRDDVVVENAIQLYRANFFCQLYNLTCHRVRVATGQTVNAPHQQRCIVSY